MNGNCKVDISVPCCPLEAENCSSPPDPHTLCICKATL